MVSLKTILAVQLISHITGKVWRSHSHLNKTRFFIALKKENTQSFIRGFFALLVVILIMIVQDQIRKSFAKNDVVGVNSPNDRTGIGTKIGLTIVYVCLPIIGFYMVEKMPWTKGCVQCIGTECWEGRRDLNDCGIVLCCMFGAGGGVVGYFFVFFVQDIWNANLMITHTGANYFSIPGLFGMMLGMGLGAWYARQFTTKTAENNKLLLAAEALAVPRLAMGSVLATKLQGSTDADMMRGFYKKAQKSFYFVELNEQTFSKVVVNDTDPNVRTFDDYMYVAVLV